MGSGYCYEVLFMQLLVQVSSHHRLRTSGAVLAERAILHRAPTVSFEFWVILGILDQQISGSEIAADHHCRRFLCLP